MMRLDATPSCAEERLDVEHVVGRRAFEVAVREVVEVLLGLQHVHALVVDLEERGQVVEVVGVDDVLRRVVLERDAVLLRQLEDVLGLQRTLEVHVQLALGHVFDELGHGRAPWRILFAIDATAARNRGARAPIVGACVR